MHRLYHRSILLRIGAALAGIVFLAAATMITSYWLSNQAGHHAYAINMAGSLRMQSYRLAWALPQDTENAAQLDALLQQLEHTWEHPLFAHLTGRHPNLAREYQQAYRHWQQLLSNLLSGSTIAASDLETQRQLLDQLVLELQHQAEASTRHLRWLQLVALLSILVISGLVVYTLRMQVQKPLSRLTQVATRIGQGDFSERITSSRGDELGLLADSFNQMSDAIASMHLQMEQKIAAQTQALQRSNTALQFLYDTAKQIIEHSSQGIGYDRIVTRLAQLIEAEDVELCLITPAGSTPYLHITPKGKAATPCAEPHCYRCLKGEEWIDTPRALHHINVPMIYQHQHYGVLVCRLGKGQQLQPWQRQLVHAVADQLAVALSLQAQQDSEHRLALVQERTVIARELHDSLAQALSYLKIQVTRLNRAIKSDDKVTLNDVAAELRQGLDSAYRQLRELLTTFRLKLEGPGLTSALETTVNQLQAQNSLKIHLDYALDNLPLSPNEEIHLLQIIREASQNALHHSGGQRLNIRLLQVGEQVHVSIEDDGVGIPDVPEKLNHYGLAIMKERSATLQGELSVRRRAEGGTGVYFQFVPEYRRKWILRASG